MSFREGVEPGKESSAKEEGASGCWCYFGYALDGLKGAAEKMQRVAMVTAGIFADVLVTSSPWARSWTPSSAIPSAGSHRLLGHTRRSAESAAGPWYPSPGLLNVSTCAEQAKMVPARAMMKTLRWWPRAIGGSVSPFARYEEGVEEQRRARSTWAPEQPDFRLPLPLLAIYPGAWIVGAEHQIDLMTRQSLRVAKVFST